MTMFCDSVPCLGGAVNVGLAELLIGVVRQAPSGHCGPQQGRLSSDDGVAGVEEGAGKAYPRSVGTMLLILHAPGGQSSEQQKRSVAVPGVGFARKSEDSEDSWL